MEDVSINFNMYGKNKTFQQWIDLDETNNSPVKTKRRKLNSEEQTTTRYRQLTETELDKIRARQLRNKHKKEYGMGNKTSQRLAHREKNADRLRQSPAEGAAAAPQRLFKVILVGNSNVGKTALLRRFCDGHFHSATSATVGIDHSVRTLNLGDSHVALQLWDTAGQERYRSITKQFFRKADGVVIIYDITAGDSFRSVRPWLASIQEAVGDPIPVMLLGNKADKDDEREVQMKEAEILAQGTHLMFGECSAYTGDNVVEAMTHLAKVLREQEDKAWVNTVRLVDQPVKKKTCCK